MKQLIIFFIAFVASFLLLDYLGNGDISITNFFFSFFIACFVALMGEKEETEKTN